MKKTITFLSRRAAVLLLVMMLTTATAWAQTTITPTTPSQDGDGYFLICTAAELYGFAELVNNGNATANAKLTADIVVNENVLDANGEANTDDFVQWTPIGNVVKGYSGTFDGQGHTISGLYVSGSSWSVGLIGTVSGSATIKNLGIVNSYFSSSVASLGSIVGDVNRQSVTLANVYSTSTVKGDNYIGGLVGGGAFGSVTIINSYFAGKTSAGWSYGTHHDDLVSGEFGTSGSGTLNIVNTFVLGTSNHGTQVTTSQLTDGTVAAALHYYQDALADGSMFGLSGGKTNFSGTIDGVSVTTANITLHTFDGDATAYSSKYVVGNTTPLPVNVACDGYNKFADWYDNANLVGNAVTSISSSETGDKEYWAKYKQSHTVTFELNGGKIEKGNIDHYIEGEVTPLPAFVLKGGASFEGWYTTSDCLGERYVAIPATATEDMTFYAKWGEAKTTFYLVQGGSREPVNVFYEGENIVWLDKTTERFMISNNEHKYWGSGTITVPYVGGEYAFSDNWGSNFVVDQSGFYVFTLTDKGEGNWFVSVLKSMLNCDVASIPTQVYTGSAIEPEVTVNDGKTPLDPDEDYEVTYSNNIDAGTATATITGKGDYSGKTAATFTIVNPVTTSYVDASGTLHENVEAVPLDNTMTTLPAGWYVVNSTFTYDHTLSFTPGDVHIILEDGCEMNIGTSSSRVGNGIVNHSSGWVGVTYIYGQTEGSGTINIYADTYGIKSRVGYVQNGGRVIISSAEACIRSDGGVTLNGGTLSLDTPDLYGTKYGIQVGGGFTMNDGVLTASTIGESFYCSNSAFKILGGKATVNSGAIFAQRSSTLGYKNNDDYIIVKSGFTCNLSIADGQAMTDGTTVYSGTIADPSALINKTLRYCYTITYNGIEGATFTTANPEAYTRESEAITLNNPSKDGYEFAGWTGTGLDAASTSVTIAKGSTGNRTYTATWTKNIVTLDEATDNGAAITTAAQSGKIYEVTLNGRTLYKDGDWNTLCLPFAVTDFTGTPLEGATVKELLTTSNLDNTGKLTLNFSDDLTAIEAGKPYIVKWTPNLTISSASDWDAFATAVSGGTTYEGQIVKLAADISVSTMVGAVSGSQQQKAFQGTFDGGGHTITVSISNTSDQGTAPFRFIKNATIKNVKTTGTVTGGMHCAGLVGFAQGTNTIQNCHVDVAVTGSGSNHSHLGGVLGHGLSSTTTITDCLFSGSISNAGTATGIIYGWADNGTHTIVNCLAAGTYTSCNDIDMMKGSDTQTATNCYKNVSDGSKGTQTDATGDALVALLGAGWVNNSGNVVPKMNANIVNPTFSDATLVATAPTAATSDDGKVSLTGTYSPFTSTDGLLFDAHNTANGAFYAALSATRDGYVIDGWYTDEGKTTEAASIPFAADGSATLYTKWIEKIPYILENGTTAYCTNYTVLDNTMTTLSAGWYVVNSNVTVNSRIDLTGDTNLILGDGYTLNVKGIYIPQGSTLTIYAQSDGVTAGKIVSKPTSGAAIGGMPGNDNGNIVIYGGIIEATGGDHCAGIGSNDGRTGGTISIYGGTVTAKGGTDGAAIGGGRNCSGGTITIYGGTITTDSDPCENGAGIGGGDCGAGGTITIYGGNITTYSRDGAGIGGGDGGDGGIITINGGTITSTKVNQGNGARIGGGLDAGPGTITINGGKITAVGGSGAGIGGGKRNPANGTVTINGGVIDAKGLYGIGAGENGADVAITLGWTNATDRIYASSYDSTVKIAAGKRLAYTDGNNVSHILGGDNMTTLTTDEKTAIASKTLTPAIVLADNADNTSAIATAATLCTGGKTLAVQLSGRTLYKDGDWNTLCLPFSVTDGDTNDGLTFSGTPLEGATVMELNSSTSNLDGKGQLTLNFTNATSIEAGKPYIVRWGTRDSNPGGTILNPVFTGVNIINSGPAPVEFDFVGNNTDCQFVGNYAPLEITEATNRNNIVVLTSGSRLGYTTSDRTIENGKALGAFRAYFYIPEKDGTTGASSFVLNADDESTQTGIGHTEITEITENSGAWYTLDGRKLQGKPTQKGLYIYKGKKVKR